MERTPATSNEAQANARRGEIVVLNGKHKGLRRALKSPLTFIGSAEGCDIRLHATSVAAMHGLVVFASDGVVFRQLDGNHESRINGKRALNAKLQDGDQLMIGPFQFQIHLTPVKNESKLPDTDWDALRVQAAAVAAQQIALGEEEVRLDERQGSLAQQEEQLAAHLDEKRRQLTQLHDKTQTERKALEQDRSAYEKYVESVTGNLTEGQRELMDGRKQLQMERDRLLRQQNSLKKHWKRRFAQNEQQLALRVEEIANDACNMVHESNHLQYERQKLQYHRASFFGQYELGRRQLVSAWDQLKDAQQQWRQRRDRERALLKLKESDLANLERDLAETREHLQNDSAKWEKQRLFMQQELRGLNQRIENQRQKLLTVEREGTKPAVANTEAHQPDETCDTNATSSIADTAKLQDLDRIASELADQRLQMAEQWEQLARAKTDWDAERVEAVAALENTANELRNKESLLDERAQGQQQIEQHLRQRHEELNRLRQNLIGWRARLHAQQTAFETERSRLLAEMERREDAAKTNLDDLNEFRKRWKQATHKELTQLRTSREKYDEQRKECLRLQQEWNEKLAELQSEKRELTEKTLALEQYRQETILKGHNSPAIERRLDRLRRRWLSQNNEAVRAATEARQSIAEDLRLLNDQACRVHADLETLNNRSAEWIEREMIWEQQQAAARAQQVKMEEEVRIWKQKNQIVEQQLLKSEQEFELVARTLMDEPDILESRPRAA